MDSKNNGKPYFLMDDLFFFPPIFGNTHIHFSDIFGVTQVVLLNTCRLQLDLEISAFHVGLVQSSTDAELAVVLVEDPWV